MKDLYPVVELVRLEESQFGTFGALKIQKRVFCVTLEPPDFENEQNKSSIPAQQYWCHRIVSPKYSETFEVKDVPGRDHVLFHAGNKVEHTKGCIILARNWGVLGRQRAVLNSGDTFTRFMNEMDSYKGFHLTVLEVF